MPRVDNSGVRLMKTHSDCGVERPFLLFISAFTIDVGEGILTLGYWVRITENETGVEVSDSISTLDIRLWLMRRVRTDSLWRGQDFSQGVPGCLVEGIQ